MKMSSRSIKKLDEKLKQDKVKVSEADVDDHGQVCCPPLKGELWSMHPRVYMPVRDEKISVCPYCSAVYEYIGD